MPSDPEENATSGPSWIHEIKFDGWRVQLHSDGTRIRVLSRDGNPLTGRFPASGKLLPCIIDAEGSGR